MSTLMKISAVLLLSLALLQGPAWSKKKLPAPVAAGASVEWVAVPQVQGVMYAPGLKTDLFCYGQKYYYYYGGAWYQGPGIQGPWGVITAPPQVFYGLDATYFKNPPGWARGKKTGWRGAPLPPGQMKKYNGGNLPPGHMKKQMGY